MTASEEDRHAGRVLGRAAQAEAAALAAGALALSKLLSAITSGPVLSLDPVAVFSDLGRTAGSIADAAAELARQGWISMEEIDAEARASWTAAISGLRAAESTFSAAANDRL